MATTTALLNGMAGLSVHAARLEVIGNNISNVSTTAFKSNRMHFTPQFSQTLSLGTSPGAISGGTNPGQVGLGVVVSATQRDFSGGAIAVTGVPTDIAIEGGGFFIVDRAGEQQYTRVGAFQLNANNDLVTVTGERVQGYTIDDNFTVIEGTLTDINIPLGTLSIAEATKNVELSGNLDADGELAVQGTVLEIGPLTAGGAPITGATLLTAIDGGNMNAGDTITISGAERGGKVVPDADFAVGAAATVDDLLAFLQDMLGVVPDGGDPLMLEPGSFAVDAAGLITFIGNFGQLNDIELGSENFVLTDLVTGLPEAHAFTDITKVSAANGESVRTTFLVYDSLGTATSIDVTMVLAQRDDAGTGWRAFLHGADDSDLAMHLETGDRTGVFDETVPMVTFDNFGALSSIPEIEVEVDRDGTGALPPLTFQLGFQTDGNNVTALSNLSGGSEIAAVFQDGAPLGTLTNFGVGQDGTITGGFSNGLTRTIGQIPLANFTNPEGLVDLGNGLWSVGPNSGSPLIAAAGEFGGGTLFGGALEGSNVDLSQEFINMILTSTGYSAASRVITTSDQMLQQLIAIVR